VTGGRCIHHLPPGWIKPDIIAMWRVMQIDAPHAHESRPGQSLYLTLLPADSREIRRFAAPPSLVVASRCG
jgi:hypothetical protein